MAALPTIGAAVGAATITTATLFGFDRYIIAFVGVPFTVVGMSAAGSMMSYAFGTGEASKPKLFFTATAATFIGSAAVTWVPVMFHIADVADPAKPVAGFFYALFARWAMPVFIDILPMLIRRWFNIPEKAKPGDKP